jgi:hypothetical protein
MMNPSAATALISLALCGADVSAEHIAPELARAPAATEISTPAGPVTRDDDPVVTRDDDAAEPRLQVTRDDDTDLEVTISANPAAK